jgi:A/G-specific adenine glycosylase
MKPAPLSIGSGRPALTADRQRDLLAWYRTHRRDLPWRQTRDPYPIWISEVMLQQTQVATVIPYYQRFLQRFPELTALARADLQQVLKLWEGLGYYRRAHHLHRAARELVDGGNGRVPDERQAFRSLPGVGDYIANAVMSIAFGHPCAVVDGNVKRVIARLEGITAEVNQAASHRIFQAAADRLLDRGDPGTFNQALMELGALVCTPRNPSCPACPWQGSCFARRNNATTDLPRRRRKAPVPEHAMAAGLLWHRRRLLIVQRPSEGLLAGLWEFPAGRRQRDESPPAACRRILQATTGIDVRVGQSLVRIRHAYTHFRIVQDLFDCRKIAGRVRLDGYQAFRWIRPRELGAFPFTGAGKKAFPQLNAAFFQTTRPPGH